MSTEDRTDVEIMQASYDKYKEKNGKKAIALYYKIKSYAAFAELVESVKNRREYLNSINKTPTP